MNWDQASGGGAEKNPLWLIGLKYLEMTTKFKLNFNCVATQLERKKQANNNNEPQ